MARNEPPIGPRLSFGQDKKDKGKKINHGAARRAGLAPLPVHSHGPFFLDRGRAGRGSRRDEPRTECGRSFRRDFSPTSLRNGDVEADVSRASRRVWPISTVVSAAPTDPFDRYRTPLNPPPELPESCSSFFHPPETRSRARKRRTIEGTVYPAKFCHFFANLHSEKNHCANREAEEGAKS